jgi:autotransporter-associated beta strand protein
MKIPFAPIALSACLLGTNAALASIAGPYTADPYTLHLWHLNETAVPCVDSVSSGAVNLSGLLNGATLGNAAYSGFGTCLNTLGIDGYDAWTNNATGAASFAGAGLFPTTTATAATTITYAGANGAFTMEALICPLFPVLTNFGTVAHGGTGRAVNAWQFVCGDSSVNGNRIWQWRFDPIGTQAGGQFPSTGNTMPMLDFININAATTVYEVYAPIPTNGPNAIASNQWFHVAVTYNGVPNTPGNFNFYWTAMNSTNTSANLILSTNLPASLLVGKPSFALGNTGRSDNSNWLGLINEVRISSVARGPSGMIFSLPNVSVTPLANEFVAVGSTVTLISLASGGAPIGYQWQFNGTNITSALFPNISGYTTNSLVISNITFAQAGTYTMIATNANSSASASATITVGSPVPGLANTGVGANGALLPGGSVDSNWQLVQSADPTYTGPSAFVDSTVPSTYIPDGPNSQWIAPGDNVNVAGGNYEYQTTFVLDSQNLTNMELIVNWAADNVCADILLNGVDLGITDNNGYASFVPTIITNNFVAGSNILVCVVSNNPGSGANLSAFRAELSGLSTPLPPTAVQLLSPPANTTTYQYQNATFAVTAYGSGPLSYQWYFGANPLGGQTNRALLLTDLDPSQAGTYTVVVTNSLSTTNATATLAVIAPNTLEWQGLSTADWDTTTTNWYDKTASAGVPFSQNANVLFDNAGSGQPAVSLDVPLTPNSVIVSADNSYTFSPNGGYLTGNFNLLLNGPGTLIMDTPNTYSGTTVIQGGTLQVGNYDANGSLGTSSISNNAALVVIRTDTVTVPNQISGTGMVTMAGSGTLLLTANNAGFTGPTAVSGGGTLTPRNPNALGTGTAGTTVLDGAQLYIDQNLNIASQPLVLGGTGPGGLGALHKGGAGSTYWGGPITLSDDAGIGMDGSSSLYLTNPAAITGTNVNLAITCASSATCTIGGAANLGSGSLTEYGTGTLILSSVSNRWTGGTTINSGGILQVGDGGADGSIGAGAIEDDGTLTFLSAANLVLTNAVSGAGIFNQSGTGRLVEANGALSSFTGAIHINGNGQLQLANGEALTNGTLTIGAAQADTNRLELTGNNVVSIPISIFPRAFIGAISANTPPVNYPNIVNLSGTNTVNPPSPITIAAGGNLFSLESDSGYMVFNAGITAAAVGRYFALQGAASGEVDGPITQGTGYSVNVWVLGPGLWALNGQSSYTGVTIVTNNGTLVVNGTIGFSPVTVSGGTFGGIGTLTGPLVVAAGAKLAPTLATGPATPIGTLTVSNTLTLQPGSITSLQINKAARTNDQITGLTSVSYAGTLSLTNLGGSLAAGDAFQLFNAASYTGAFSSIIPANPGPGLSWNLTGLNTSGLLSVTSTTPPTVTSTTVSGGNLILSGTGGAPGSTYLLLTSTNVATPLTNWIQVANGAFDGNGNFAVTNAMATNVSRSFFLLRAQ